MSLLNIAATGRRVWILMFDHLQIEGADAVPLVQPGVESPTLSPDHFNAFDDLDLSCSSFEQYVLQDSRACVTLTDVLGGQDAFEQFNRLVNEHKKSSGRLRLSCQQSSPDQGHAGLPSALSPKSSPDSPATIERQLPSAASDDSIPIDPELLSMLSADVVWIEAISSDGDCEEDSDRLLKVVQRWRLESQSDSASMPVLIVSAIHGYAREVNEPFASGLDESLIRVPLWIDHGVRHACRIQTLAGSFDLLPTVLDFVLDGGDKSEPTPIEPPKSSPQSEQLEGAPLSLAGVCSHRKPLPDRLLSLTGDSWTALRTQQYLLVQPIIDSASGEEAGYSADDEQRANRSLYLKPDDVWNVNDAIVSYSSIADQMERTAAGFQHRDK